VPHGGTARSFATLRALGAAVSAALVASSCSIGSPAGSPPSMTSSSSTPPPSVRPNEVTPEHAVDLRKVAWTDVEREAGGKRLRVHATFTGGPPCTVLGRVDVAETDDAVTVTLWAGRRPDADCGGPQPQLAFPIVVGVQLDRELGTRAVRDGAR
jgi:hypothetical protein